MAWMGLDWALHKKPTALGMISGAVAGLVAITPAAGYVGPASAIVIGAASGACCLWGATSLKRRLGYDDSLDAFGVHGVGGIVGALLTGVFASEAIGGTPGMIEGNFGQLLTQLYGIGATIVYCAVVTYVILKLIDATMGLRVDEKTEAVGLDVSLHGERGYEI
jgi:Amt family ammonium transporter